MPPGHTARRTRHISWAPSGWLVDHTTAHRSTDFVTLTCPDDFLAIRLGFTNINLEPYVITKAIAIASTTPHDHVNPTGVSFWRPLTFANNGRAVDEIVVAADAPTTITVWGRRDQPSHAPGAAHWTWTDWAPLSSVRRTDSADAPRVVMIRLLLPEGCHRTTPNGGLMEFHRDPAMNLGSCYVGGQIPLDLVTVPETVSVRDANIGIAFPAVSCVQFLTRNEGFLGMAAGDSHHQGTSTTTQYWNYLMRSTLELNARHAGRIPFGYWSTAQGGADSDYFFSRLTNVLDVARPSFVVLPGWSYNDTNLTVHADHMANLTFLSRLLMTAEACARSGAVPVFLTPFPRDAASMTPVQVAAWRSLRDTICSLRESGAVVLDATPILARQANGLMDGTYQPEYTDDTVHPNDAGHAALAAALTPVIERVCGLT
jgi:hypothetical protein